MSEAQQLNAQGKRLGRLLAERNLKIVFAESCTGGLASATLTRIPGISAWLCGSAVVYQLETKARWLGVSRDLLKKPGPVSREVAEAMANGVLRKTPRADAAVSVTGHLGPDAPPGQDGLVFVSVAKKQRRGDPAVQTRKFRLTEFEAADEPRGPARRRVRRQQRAARLALETACNLLGTD